MPVRASERDRLECLLIDKDGDGILSPEELKNGKAGAFGLRSQGSKASMH